MTDWYVEIPGDVAPSPVTSIKPVLVEVCKQGPPGTSSALDVKSVAEREFNTNDENIFSSSYPITLTKATVKITEAFADDPLAKISLGVFDEDEEKIMEASIINPQAIGEYETTLNLELPPNALIVVYVNTGGILGNGVAIIEYVQRS